MECNIPKWKKYPLGLLIIETQDQPVIAGKYGHKKLYYKGYCIELKELEKLPKEK